MPKVKVPDVVKEWFQTQGIDKIANFLNFDNKIVPVFIMNPEGSEGYVRDPYRSYQQQADALLDQAAPVSTTAYEVLETTLNVRLLSVIAKVTWTVQPTPLDVIVTIDGQVITFTKGNPVTATNYYARLKPQVAMTAQELHTAASAVTRTFMLEGRSVKVEAKTTGGTVSNLTCRVKYAKLP